MIAYTCVLFNPLHCICCCLLVSAPLIAHGGHAPRICAAHCAAAPPHSAHTRDTETTWKWSPQRQQPPPTTQRPWGASPPLQRPSPLTRPPVPQRDSSQVSACTETMFSFVQSATSTNECCCDVCFAVDTSLCVRRSPCCAHDLLRQDGMRALWRPAQQSEAPSTTRRGTSMHASL